MNSTITLGEAIALAGYLVGAVVFFVRMAAQLKDISELKRKAEEQRKMLYELREDLGTKFAKILYDSSMAHSQREKAEELLKQKLDTVLRNGKKSGGRE